MTSSCRGLDIHVSATEACFTEGFGDTYCRYKVSLWALDFDHYNGTASQLPFIDDLDGSPPSSDLV